MVRAQQDRSANQACEERLTVPVGTLLGWSGAPAQAAGWGLLDPGVILSFRVSQVGDLRRPVVDSVADGTRAA